MPGARLDTRSGLIAQMVNPVNRLNRLNPVGPVNSLNPLNPLSPPASQFTTPLSDSQTAYHPCGCHLGLHPCPAFLGEAGKLLGCGDHKPDRSENHQIKRSIQGASHFAHRSILSHAITAELRSGVSELARVLDKKTRLADELARLLWKYTGRGLSPLVGVLVVLVVVVVVVDYQTLLQDDVEACLHLVEILVVVVVLVVFTRSLGGRRHHGHDAGVAELLEGYNVVAVDIAYIVVVTDVVVAYIVVEFAQLFVVELVG